MPSFRSTVLAVAASLLAVAHADYVIDPNSVPLSRRQAWCTQEKDICPIICQQTGDGTTKVNECDPKLLTYGCICGDGLQPNVSEYSLTLPYFVCQEWGNQCVTDCKNNNRCASSCREDHPCGASDPTTVNTTSTGTASATATAKASTTSGSANTIYTSVSGTDNKGSGSSSNSGDKPGAASTLEAGRTLGLIVVMGSMFAGFVLM